MTYLLSLTKQLISKIMKYILLTLSFLFAMNTVSAQKITATATHTINLIPNAVNLFNSIKNSSVDCYRIPAIVTAPNGDVIVAVDERVPSCADLRGNKNINIVIRRSAYNGKTWSKIERIVDFPEGQSASDPSMIVDTDTKTIFLFYNYMDLNKAPNCYYLQYVKSVDNGKTWSKPVDITSQIAPQSWQKDFKFITSGRGIYTSTGKLLHCLVNLQKGLHVFGSDDHGATWYLIDTPIKVGDESKIAELADGSWMINSRVNKGGYRYVHTSTDEGKHWTSAVDTTLIDPGCNGSFIRYTLKKEGFTKNRLLFANSKSKNERKNLTVRISYDEGKTWNEGRTIYTGDAAYVSLTILKNGDIGLVFETDNYTAIEFVHFSLEWLTFDEDFLDNE